MKKIAFMMLALAATLSFASCNESESDYATDVTYGNVIGTSPVTIMTDNNQQLVVADSSPIGGAYAPTYGQRVLIYYKRMQSAQTGSESNMVKLFGYVHFDNAETAILAAGEEIDYGQLDVDIYRPDTYYLVHATKRSLDMAMVFTATEGKLADHEFTLVLDEDEPIVDNYLNLTLAHGATEEEADVKNVGISFFTFDMTQFSAHSEGTSGILITASGIDSKDPVVHKFEWGF